MTHPSLNLGWLFSSSTNIYTHQQSTPSPPPVTLPPVLPLTCIHSHVNFMGRYKKKQREAKQIRSRFSNFFVYNDTSVHFE